MEFVIFFAAFVILSAILVPLKIATDRQRQRDAMAMGDDTLVMPNVAYQPVERSRARQPVQPTATHSAVSSAQPMAHTPAYQPVPARQMLAPLNYLLHLQDTAVHVLIVGNTDAGKTTLARAFIARRLEAREQLIVLDPHKSADDWIGLTCYGAGQDYAAIDQQLAMYVELMTQRYQERATIKGYNPSPITIVIDEWPSIKAHCQQASEFIKLMSREARKIKIRLIIMTQSDRVASLGIEGEGDTRENFSMAYVGGKAASKWDSNIPKPAYGAIWKQAGTDELVMIDATMTQADIDHYEQVIEMYGATSVNPNVATSVNRIDHQFSQASSKEYAETWANFGANQSLLESLINRNKEPLPVADDLQKSQQSDHQEVVRVEAQEVATEGQEVELPNDDLSVAIRELTTAGFSRNKVIDLLAAKLPGKNALKYQVVKYALGEISENPLQSNDD